MGNVLKNNVRLYTSPPIYGGLIDGTVDCVSSLIELGYKELEGNHVMAFAKQGGGIKKMGKSSIAIYILILIIKR